MNIISIIIGFIFGGAAAVFLTRPKRIDEDAQKEQCEQMVKKAKSEGYELLQKAKEKQAEMIKTAQNNINTLQEFIKKIEISIAAKEEAVNKKTTKNNEIHEIIKQEENVVHAEREKVAEREKEMRKTLERRAGKSPEDIKLQLVRQVEQEMQQENEYTLKILDEYYKEHAEKEARNIVVSALQRLSTPASVDKKGLQVTVTNDANKPNVVGTNGENILYLEEKLDNVNVIFNDFPNTITISHYNLLNRHITKKTIERLFAYKGHITPKVVDDAIEEAKKETDRELMVIGREALKRMNIRRPMPDECLQVIGRLQFRSSYGQNIMRHSYEVGIFALMMAYELGLEIETAKISGFLHDLGKAIDQNPDIIGAHDYLTKELMEKFTCFSEPEIHAAWTHHDSEPPKTPEAFLVKGADAMSAGRPGARQESLDKYIERITALQDIALSYEGVDKVSAMSAGREVRVSVIPSEINDKDMQPLADAIAGEIKENVAYPGYVRVNIIRTTKSIETARPKAPPIQQKQQ